MRQELQKKIDTLIEIGFVYSVKVKDDAEDFDKVGRWALSESNGQCCITYVSNSREQNTIFNFNEKEDAFRFRMTFGGEIVDRRKGVTNGYYQILP